MQNLILQPTGSAEALKHFKDTVDIDIDLNSIKQYLKENDFNSLKEIYPNGKSAIWGVKPGEKLINIKKYERTNPGDLVLFTANKKVICIAILSYKVHSKDLASFLWGIDKNDNQTWEYIYFLKNATKDNFPISKLNALLGYASNNVVMGFNVLDEEKAKKVLDSYGSFEDALSDAGSNFSEPTQEEIDSIDKIVEQEKNKLSLPEIIADLEKSIKAKGRQEKVRTIRAIIRNNQLADAIKLQCDYTCYKCKEKGFEKRNGGYYIEVHHKEELGSGGQDLPDNMICVCANCHRKIHYGKD